MADDQTTGATNTGSTTATGAASTTQTTDTTKTGADNTTSTTTTTATGDKQKTTATGAAGDGTKTVQPTFGDNWRKDLAGDDDKAMKRLERFNSPKDIVSSYLELEKKLSAGPTKPTLPANATDDQKAEYRKAIGVPESADKYDLTLPGGLVLGETDKPLVDSYLKYAFENNLPNDVVKANLGWYLPLAKEMEIQQQENDKEYQVTQEETLRKEWGGEFKQNINLIGGLLETAPEEIVDQLMLGRTADGRIIGDDPRMLKLISQWAREINPVQTVVPNAGSNAPQAIADEIGSLVKMSGDRNSEYWSKDKGPGLQQRLRDLNEAQARIKDKGKAA